MTYNKTSTVVFVETRQFSQLLKEYLTDDEYRELQQHIMANPAAGSIIRESGGMRKIRWAQKGKGKSGGVRVIYYWVKNKDHIYMLNIYNKSEKDNIDKKTLLAIRKYLESL